MGLFRCRPLVGRLASRLQPFLPAVAVSLCVLSVTVLPQLRYGPEPPVRSVLRQTAYQPRVRKLAAETAAELQARLERAWSADPDRVPSMAPHRFPEDLDQLPVGERKVVFFRSLLPHVLDHNDRIVGERDRLAQLAARTVADAPLEEAELRFLARLSKRYRLDQEGQPPSAQVKALLRRVDVVPPSLALAQAAIESAWGTSRFARLGNNLFGQWVFDRDRGIAPLDRPDGANYSLARFRNLGDAVDAYLRNLNGFHAYREFRHLRRQMRAAGGPLDPYRLAAGLSNYSTRRHEYVREVRAVIRGNDLTRYDQARLVLPDETSLL